MPSTMRRSTGNLSSSQKDFTEVTKAATTAGSDKPSFMKATSSSSAKRAPPQLNYGHKCSVAPCNHSPTLKLKRNACALVIPSHRNITVSRLLVQCYLPSQLLTNVSVLKIHFTRLTQDLMLISCSNSCRWQWCKFNLKKRYKTSQNLCRRG